MRSRILGAACAACAFAASSSASHAQTPTGPASARAATQIAAPGDMRRGAKRQLVERHMFLARRLGHVRGEPLSRAERRRKRAVLHQLGPSLLRAYTARLLRTVRRARARRFGGAPNVPIPPQLAAIAQCESRGNPRAISAGGTYRGKYQFSLQTWATVGGTGDPAAASETEQDRRAAMLYRRDGPGHWPNCGR